MQPVMWGASGLAASTTVNLWQGYYAQPSNDSSIVQIRMPCAGTFQTARVHCGAAGVSAGTLTFTMKVNGTASSLVVSMSNTATDGSDTTHTATVAAGDLVRVTLVIPAGVTPPLRVAYCAAFVPS